MSQTSGPSYSEKLIAAIGELYPQYLEEPLDIQRSGGNAAAFALGPGGSLHGRIFGRDSALGQRSFQIGTRKLLQVWRTGYRTGEFEKLVYSDQISESTFGLQRPDLVGWLGGVPLRSPDGQLIAAAFSGFRGFKDVEIIERAADAVGLTYVPALASRSP